VAAVGVGNNISALVQGITLRRATGSLVGIRRPVLHGVDVGDIDFVAAYDRSADKVGMDLAEAIFLPPNNFPRLSAGVPPAGIAVSRGLTDTSEVDRVAGELAAAATKVVLYAASRSLLSATFRTWSRRRSRTSTSRLRRGARRQ